ncbi:MAG: hypothetical protein P8X96_15515 [Desulfobacteraceae bacterium]
MPHNLAIAYFITAHGFGHACRAAAVMEAILQRYPETRFELFTTSPQELFASSIGHGFGYHPINSDIGVVQLSPLEEDLSATCDQLDRAFPFKTSMVDEIAGDLIQLKCRLVICDISPLGIEVARSAGIESVLVENFTWDWIYRSYQSSEPRFGPHIQYLVDVYRHADHHIQSPPICRPATDAVGMSPISRRVRSERHQVRKRLGISDEEKMVLLSMGGIPDRHAFLSQLPEALEWYLVVAGAGANQSPRKRIRLLPTFSEFFHPDLMAAADALVGKAGYSTVAEAYHCGIPFGYIKRPRSPESAVLESFIDRYLPSMAIPAAAYPSGEWITKLPDLFCKPRSEEKKVNGADQVADYIGKLLA